MDKTICNGIVGVYSKCAISNNSMYAISLLSYPTIKDNLQNIDSNKLYYRGTWSICNHTYVFINGINSYNEIIWI